MVLMAMTMPIWLWWWRWRVGTLFARLAVSPFFDSSRFSAQIGQSGKKIPLFQYFYWFLKNNFTPIGQSSKKLPLVQHFFNDFKSSANMLRNHCLSVFWANQKKLGWLLAQIIGVSFSPNQSQVLKSFCQHFDHLLSPGHLPAGLTAG